MKREFVVDTARHKEGFIAWLTKQPMEPVLCVSVEPEKRRRSNKQNARMWALHDLAGQHCGCSPAEMHEIALCAFFGAVEVVTHLGTVRRPRRTTTTNESMERDALTPSEFTRWMEWLESKYIEHYEIWLGKDDGA